jgi:hypothetical protein
MPLGNIKNFAIAYFADRLLSCRRAVVAEVLLHLADAVEIESFGAVFEEPIQLGDRRVPAARFKLDHGSHPAILGAIWLDRDERFQVPQHRLAIFGFLSQS